jgi:hypothetical protein
MIAIDWNPAPRQCRQFAFISATVLVMLAGWNAAEYGWSSLVAVMLGAGGLLGVCGAGRPESVRWLYVGIMVATYPIGWVMSHVILAVIFYGVFTPVGLLFRLIGRDALQRRLEPNAVTYWQPKRQPTGPSQYLRQF